MKRLTAVLLMAGSLGFACGKDPAKPLRESGSDLTGTVVQAESLAPISGAFVINLLAEDAPHLRTDATGAFHRDAGIGDARADFLIGCPGYVNAVVRAADIEAESPGHYELVVVLQPGESEFPLLHGIVVDATSQQPLAGAEVNYTNTSGTSDVARTDANGRYELPYRNADQGYVRVTVGAEGYESIERREESVVALGTFEFELNVQMTRKAASSRTS